MRARQIRGFSREFVTLRVAQFVCKNSTFVSTTFEDGRVNKRIFQESSVKERDSQIYTILSVILRFFNSALTIIKYTKGKINLTPETESQYLAFMLF